MNARPLMNLGASGFTQAYSMENYLRVCIQIEIALNSADGEFYVVTRADPTAPWVRHGTFTAAKAGAAGLSVLWNWPDRCGHEIAIEWDRTGGSGEAAVFIHMDSQQP